MNNRKPVIHVFLGELVQTMISVPYINHETSGKTKGGDYKTYFNDLWRFDYIKNRWLMFSEASKELEQGRWKEKEGLKVVCMRVRDRRNFAWPATFRMKSRTELHFLIFLNVLKYEYVCA